MHKRDLSQVFASFSQLKIMVIGDVMVDAYLFGHVDRISPEAPVPIVSVEKRLNRLGGAANVALNLKSLGATPVLCSVIGQDQKGEEFLGLLEEQGIRNTFVFRSADRKTTTKFRVIGNKVQMLRVDEEVTDDLNKNEESKLIDLIFKALTDEQVDAIIFQDYNKGTLTPKLIGDVIDRANQLQIPVIVDPKRKNFNLFRNVQLFKPNLKELREGLNMEANPQEKGSVEKAADELHDRQAVRMVMVTLSEAGVFISEKQKDGSRRRYRVQAHVRSIADVSGAGDTVVSVAALCLAASMDALEIAEISNLAGGLVCEDVGVVPVNKERLLAELKRLV